MVGAAFYRATGGGVYRGSGDARGLGTGLVWCGEFELFLMSGDPGTTIRAQMTNPTAQGAPPARPSQDDLRGISVLGSDTSWSTVKATAFNPAARNALWLYQGRFTTTLLTSIDLSTIGDGNELNAGITDRDGDPMFSTGGHWHTGPTPPHPPEHDIWQVFGYFSTTVVNSVATQPTLQPTGDRPLCGAPGWDGTNMLVANHEFYANYERRFYAMTPFTTTVVASQDPYAAYQDFYQGELSRIGSAGDTLMAEEHQPWSDASVGRVVRLAGQFSTTVVESFGAGVQYPAYGVEHV